MEYFEQMQNTPDGDFASKISVSKGGQRFIITPVKKDHQQAKYLQVVFEFQGDDNTEITGIRVEDLMAIVIHKQRLHVNNANASVTFDDISALTHLENALILLTNKIN